jgi:hypothetical protein
VRVVNSTGGSKDCPGLERLTPHNCRDTLATLMIVAGVNAKALSTFMGHANISITLDRYGHLMPGSEEEAAGMLDPYLEAQREAAEERARAAAPASGWVATSTEVLGEDAVGSEGGREPIGFLSHVGPDDGAKVPDQLLVAPVSLVVVPVDLVLGVAVPAPPLALGAAEFDVPAAVALLVPADGLHQDGVASRAAVHAIRRLLLVALETRAFLRLARRSFVYTQKKRPNASNGVRVNRVRAVVRR